MGRAARYGGAPDPEIVKEGGYQPTSDPGPVPASLIREVDERAGARTQASGGLPDRYAAKALAHELRVRILAILNQREASPQELSKLLDEPLSQVAYHVNYLVRYGIVGQTKTLPRAGAVEHFFAAKDIEWLPDVLEMLSPANPSEVQGRPIE